MKRSIKSTVEENQAIGLGSPQLRPRSADKETQGPVDGRHIASPTSMVPTQYKTRRKALQPQMLFTKVIEHLSRFMNMSTRGGSTISSSKPTPAVIVPTRRKTTTDKDEPRTFTPFASASATDLASADSRLTQGCTVLLVDDNIINQNVGARILISLGCRVYIAHDGEDAISQICVCAGIPSPTVQSSESGDFVPPRPARSKSLSALIFRRAIAPDPIDVVLMDYQMPIKDGLTATQEIRAMEDGGSFSAFEPNLYFGKRWPTRLPIIASTTMEGQEIHDALVNAGVDGFTKKPFSVESLRATVETAMSMKTSRFDDTSCECCAP